MKYYSIMSLFRVGDEQPHETAAQHPINLDQWIEMIRLDVQALLNTKQSIISMTNISQAPLLLLHYGLPHIGKFNPLSHIDQKSIAQYIQQAIEHFEPRLQDIVVKLNSPRSQENTLLRFHIHANLNKEYTISFVSDFNIHSKQFYLHQTTT